MGYEPFVIAAKNEGGTAIIAMKEYQGYSQLKRSIEFYLVLHFRNIKDERKHLSISPRLIPVLAFANAMGLGQQ